MKPKIRVLSQAWILAIPMVFDAINPLSASAIVIDFNQPDDIAGFNQQYSGVQALITRPSGGIGGSGSGGLAAGFNSATFGSQEFDFSFIGAEITLSTFFYQEQDPQLPDGVGFSFGEVYLVPEPDGLKFRNNSMFVSFRRTNRGGIQPLQDEIFGGPLQAGGGSFPGFDSLLPVGTFTPGHWHKLQVTYQNLGNQLGFNVMIDDFGTDGTTFLETAASLSAISPDLLGFTHDSSVYAGFFLTSDITVDNFSVIGGSRTDVPEPTTLLGASLALCGGGLFKCKLSKKRAKA